MTKTTPVQFFRQVRQEIGKISWPTRKETLVTTAMVCLLSVVAACFFLAADGVIGSVIGYLLG